MWYVCIYIYIYMLEALVVNGQSDRALELIHKELASETIVKT